jgi:hypothetical protein
VNRTLLLAVAVAAVLLLAIVGATAQALRGERPILFGGW